MAEKSKVTDTNNKAAISKKGDKLDIVKLKEMKITELIKLARSFKVEGASSLRKQELLFKILQAQAQKAGRLRFLKEHRL